MKGYNQYFKRTYHYFDNQRNTKIIDTNKYIYRKIYYMHVFIKL